jgi:hypothetical protein
VRIPHRLELHPGYSPEFLVYAKGDNGYCYPSNRLEYVPVKYRVGDPYGAMQWTGGGGRTPNVVVEEVLAIPITCYPRREGRFAVDIKQDGGKQLLATFQIANPNTLRPAAFPSESLPATRAEQDLKVTLDSIAPVSKREYVLPNGSTIWAPSKEAPKGGVLLAGAAERHALLRLLRYSKQKRSGKASKTCYACDRFFR